MKMFYIDYEYLQIWPLLRKNKQPFIVFVPGWKNISSDI